MTLSYPWLDKAQPADRDDNPNAKDKYGAVLVFPDMAAVAAAKAAALAAATTKWGAKGAEKVTFGGPKSTFRTDVTGKYPEGSIYISARNETQPGLVYPHADPSAPVEEGKKPKPMRVQQEKIKDVFYPGAKVKAQVSAFAYERKTGSGIGWALDNVQYVSDGERLDNRVKAEDAFEAELNQAPIDDEALKAMGLA